MEGLIVTGRTIVEIDLLDRVVKSLGERVSPMRFERMWSRSRASRTLKLLWTRFEKDPSISLWESAG